MNLNEVRKSINTIDADMKELFDKRFICSKKVAEVKISTEDEVFKPEREKEICERYSDDNSRWYLPFVKKVMQISRKYQYEIFFDKVDSVSEELLAVKASILERGMLELKLRSDRTKEKGLALNDILSIIADASLDIRKLTVSEDGCVDVLLDVDNQDKSIREALVLAYMMQKETI